MSNTNQTKKMKKNSSGGLYIALAVCILSVICVGVYGAVLGLVKPISNVTKTEQNGTSLPNVIVEDPAKDSKPSNTQKNDVTDDVPPNQKNNQSKPQTETDKDVSALPVSPEYVLPLVGEVIKEFSDELLVYSETMNDYRVHNGIDISAVIGERVKALTDGVVEKVYDDPLMGKTVILDHGNGLKTVYQGLVPAVPDGIEEGAAVHAGDVIGGVGESALIECAEEPHLHFEVWKDGKPVNPREYF